MISAILLPLTLVGLAVALSWAGRLKTQLRQSEFRVRRLQTRLEQARQTYDIELEYRIRYEDALNSIARNAGGTLPFGEDTLQLDAQWCKQVAQAALDAPDMDTDTKDLCSPPS